MVDTVTAQVLEQGIRRYNVLLSNQSDGTGESAVIKIDPFVLTPPCARLVIRKIKFTTVGMSAMLFFDGAGVDRPFYICPADFSDEVCFDEVGGLPPPYDLAAPSGKILLSTTGHSAGDSYVILIEASKKYEALVP